MRAMHTLAMAAALAIGTTASAGVLYNQSFENNDAFGNRNWAGDKGGDHGWSYSGWHVSILRNSYPGYELVQSSNADGDKYVKLYRTKIQTLSGMRVPVQPGQTVTLSFMYAAFEQVWDSPRVYIDFYDENDWYVDGNPPVFIPAYTPVASVASGELANLNWGGYVPGTFNTYTMSAVVPDGVTHVAVRTGAPNANADWWVIGFDNFDLTIVPEPGSLVVIGLAGLLLGRRRD